MKAEAEIERLEAAIDSLETDFLKECRRHRQTARELDAERELVRSLHSRLNWLEANLRHSEAVRLQQNQELSKLGHISETYQ